jgi:hypothetical protein
MKFSRFWIASAVKRALANLLENAWQAMTVDGRIWIVARDVVSNHLAYVEIELGNTGSYIEPARAARIFEPFFTAGKIGGTGLGLAITQKVALMHGGAVSCRSNRSHGTAFVLLLPAGAAETPTQAGQAAFPRCTSEVRRLSRSLHRRDQAEMFPKPAQRVVAVVEDDPFVSESWRHALQVSDVLTFDSPEAFFVWLGAADTSPTLATVITDFHFSGSPLTGLDVARTIRAQHLGVPIVLASDSLVMELSDAERGVFTKVVAKDVMPLANLMAGSSPRATHH